MLSLNNEYIATSNLGIIMRKIILNANTTFSIKIKNNSINVTKGDFTGNIPSAIDFIQDFYKKKTVEIKSFGYGYGELKVDGKVHHINPYGIDLNMMISFCGGDPHNFNENNQKNNLPLDNVMDSIKSFDISKQSLFKPAKQPVIVQRKTDILTVVESKNISEVTANDINDDAGKQPKVPHYQPDGIGAILVFHIDGDLFVLGAVRNNPALAQFLTPKNTSFPQQINAAIGGYLANPELSLKDSMLNAIKNKILLKEELTENMPGYQAQQVLHNLCKTIENNDGWEDKICVHTDQWMNKDESKGTMCFLTGIKHINCNLADLVKINEALQTMMAMKQAEDTDSKTLSAFKFIPLKPVIANSLASHLEDEITKATKGYEQFGNQISVSFNDLAIATLVKNNAFRSNLCAQLTLDNHSVPRKTI